MYHITTGTEKKKPHTFLNFMDTKEKGTPFGVPFECNSVMQNSIYVKLNYLPPCAL